MRDSAAHNVARFQRRIAPDIEEGMLIFDTSHLEPVRTQIASAFAEVGRGQPPVVIASRIASTWS